METGFITVMITMVLFGILATYDGIYLHIFKYRLYEHPESKFEHLTHTIRAVLFPFMLYYLFLSTTPITFYIGLSFVVFDVLVLGVDAYVEKDSRAFMGGLPRWEYIVHLFVNGFHFASITVFLVLKLDLAQGNIIVRDDFGAINAYSSFVWLIENLIPGAMMMGLLHIVVAFKTSAMLWNKVRNKMTCC